MNAPFSNSDAPSLTLSGEALRTHAREWLEKNLPEKFRTDRMVDAAPTLEESKTYEAALYRAGLVGITWPRAYGGYGRTLREHLVVSQEIGSVPMPESVNSIGKELAGPIILAIGNEEQKKSYLPAILEMREIWCQGFSEPGAGSDLAGLRTRAEKIGGKWRVNGQKIWTSGAYRAQRCLLLARTGTVEDRHRGLCLFAVPMDTPGIRVNKIRSIDGKESFCEVFFDDVEVDEADALGLPDEGWNAAIRVLSIERATNRMHRSWRFENEMRHLVSACNADPALKALLDDGYYRRQLARIGVDLEVLKGHIETVVEALSDGQSVGARGSISKLHWSEAHQRFVALAFEMLAKASKPDLPEVRAVRSRFENLYLLSFAETIYAGTTEIQLGIIADRIMQLPKGRK
ncbi:acyl-CoA dehydrogenase family protein [Aquamicrobium sp. LC103]|uniref:acyl-CoA dehydrogenase family protein n=1 Tax=Aquamicrobium sp. LC103 TaxID=1120658 RepID=UPI0010C9FCCF|nr:acyl-CoA dehydrogenase family protein [Aquamicrobium sp. LC103]TKT69630.1 acyl-CoA dehydrogenase [Aquamicrobium sp. LC103]